MNIAKEIEKRISKALAPELIKLVNESHNHIGHAGDNGSGKTHFKLMVVSGAFDGCNRIERHRIVFKEINSLFEEGLHALSLEVFTPIEYKENKNTRKGCVL